MATASNSSGGSSSISQEIANVRKNLPKVTIHSATSHFVTAIYEKTPRRRIKLTLTFPEGYPGDHPLIVDVAAERGVPPGLKKKIEKELSEVAKNQLGKEQTEAVLGRLVNFVDTNKFVPCWRELKQVVELVQNSARLEKGKGSTVAINDNKGLIKLRLQGSKYYYSCSITIDEAYPTTTNNQDWGKACKLVMNSTNFPPKIENLLTIQAHDLIRRMQDCMSAQDALNMSNPIKAPEGFLLTSNSKKEAPKVRLTQAALKGLHHDAETLAHVRDLRDVNASKNVNIGKAKAHSAKERKEARREIGKITQNEVKHDKDDEERERQWQLEEQARLAGYDFAVHDGSNPQPSLHTLVLFLKDKIQHLPEEVCPICMEPSLPEDPTILKSLYTNPVATAPEAENKARRMARKQRPVRTYCGCWYHHSCLHTFMTKPPFGAACPCDGRRVYHPDWPSDMSQLEREWAHKEARKREIEDAALAFM
jgi:hypothetical protein